MKILHVFHHSNLVNGVDRTTLTLLRALRKQGQEGLALVPQVGDVTAALDELGVGYRIANLGCCTGPAKLAELAYLSRAATRAKEIEAWIREANIELVHMNTGHLLDAAIAASRTGTASLWHIHAPFEIDLERYSGFMAPEGYAWLLEELGSHVIAVSDDVRTSLLNWLPASQVTTLYNGIDIEDLEQRARQPHTSLRADLGLAPDTPLVMGVGRISAQKDFATFVRVAQRVVDSHATACFAIAGPAEDKTLADAVQKQVVELGLSRRVFLLGPRRDVPALLAQSDAFLSTAIFEGQGLAALEAMSLGKPAVAMDCVGLRECIQNEIDGLLVSLGDVDACASAVMRVLADRTLAATLGARGRESVASRYSATAYAKGFLDIANRARATNQIGRNVPAASFALGLLEEVHDAHGRLIKARTAQKGLGARVRERLPIFFNKS
jgi:glycosyltransferase involved in cell wall biosynthesis